MRVPAAPAHGPGSRPARARARRPRRPAAPPARARSLDRAPAELFQLLLEGLPERHQELARGLCLLLVDLRHGEANVDEHPVPDADGFRAFRQQADVDVSPDAGHLRLGDVVLLVDELNDLTRNSQAHAYIILLAATAACP